MYLTPKEVHRIRTSGLTDAAMSRELRVPVATVWKARTGVTHRAHRTPPDRRPRWGGGRKSTTDAVHQ